MHHRNPRRENLTRRRFLRGVGACMALPALESLLPGLSRAMAAEAANPLAVTSTGAPLRMAFMYIPNGVHQANWWPTGEGKAYQLNKTMEPLAKVKDSIQVIGGL